jgi:hypothetical protein
MDIIINVKSDIVNQSTSAIKIIHYSMDIDEVYLLNKIKNTFLSEKEKYDASVKLKKMLKTSNNNKIKKHNYVINIIIFCYVMFVYRPFMALFYLFFDNLKLIEKKNKIYSEKTKKNLKKIYLLMNNYEKKKDVVSLKIFGDSSFISLNDDKLEELKQMAIGNIIGNIFFLKKNTKTSTHEIFQGVPLLFYQYEFAIKFVGNSNLFKFIFNTPLNGERLLINGVKLIKEKILVKIPDVHFIIGLPSSGKTNFLNVLLKNHFNKKNVVVYDEINIDFNIIKDIRKNIYDNKIVFIINSKLCNVNYFNEVIMNLKIFDKDSIRIFGFKPNINKSIENLKKKVNDGYLLQKKIKNIIYLESVFKIDNYENIEIIESKTNYF